MNRQNTIVAAALLAALAIVCPRVSKGQETHQGESFELDGTLDTNLSHEYVANNYISLNKGFFSDPSENHNTFLHLDSYGVFPPDEGITHNGSVVGTLEGIVDVGAIGAACYKIPVSVPSGINGMQPNLYISYNSQMDDGLLGWGWDLEGLSVVQRVNSSIYYDGYAKAVDFHNDQYTIDGQRLIKIDSLSKDGSLEYRTETDRLNKIIAYTREVGGSGMFGTGHHEVVTHFVVWNADGRRIEYGNSNDSKINLQEHADVCLWLVNRVEDRDGNYMEFHYEKNTYGYRLASITYTGNDTATPVLTPFCEVVFNYETRSDVKMTTVGPCVMKYPDLLKSIAIAKRNVKEQSIAELYRYDFDYYDIDRPNGYIYSRLHSILFSCGEQQYKPTIVVWPDMSNHVELTHSPVSTYGHDNAFANAVKFPGDFNGDGFTDVIVTRPTQPDNTYEQAELYLNKGSGGSNATCFSHVRTFSLGDNSDWIHVGDFNGDGKDDLLFVNKVIRSWPLRDKLYIQVYLSDMDANGSLVFRELDTPGPYYTNIRFRKSAESVIIGDYFAKGYDGIIIQSSADLNDPDSLFMFDQAHYIECAPDGQSLVEHCFDEYMASYRLFPADYDGDGATEILYLTENGCFVNKVEELNGVYHYVPHGYDQSINSEYDCYTGDFNGDGKTDLLSCHIDGSQNTVWQVNLSNGTAFMEPYIANNIGCDYLGSTYMFTLQKPHETMYFVKVADFNGDGYADVRYRETSGQHRLCYCFGPITESGVPAPFSRKKSWNSQQVLTNNMASCLGLFTGKESCDDMGDNQVFRFMPSSERYSVDRIVDGLNNSVEFSYGYLMPNPDTLTDDDFYQLDDDAADYSKHVLSVGLPIKVLKKVSSKNVSNRPVSVNYKYRGLLFHQWGKGILGLTGKKSTQSITIIDSKSHHEEVLGSSETSYNLTDYNPFIELALSSARTYDKNGFMMSETNYENGVYANVGSANQRVFYPITKKATTEEFDIDNECFLRKTIAETSYYNDGNDAQYYNIVRPTCTIQGVTSIQQSVSASECEFQTTELVSYIPDELGNWLINRPYQVRTISTKDNESSDGNCIEYAYFTDAGHRHRVKSVIDIPNNHPDTGPDYSDTLSTKKEYGFDSFGRVNMETVTAPNDTTLPELTSIKDYGAEYDYRLITRTENPMGDETVFAYDDDYDFCTSVTDFNGQTTHYSQDPLGITKHIVFPDGTESCQAIRWESYGYNKVRYSVWNKTTGSAPTKEYIDRTGLTCKTESRDFRGDAVVAEIEFDQYGRVFSKEIPHYLDETPEKISYEYDSHNRLITTINPDSTRQEVVHNGLETTVKNIAKDSTEQRTTSLTNIMGWITNVTDASMATVVYGYYPDGKPRRVSANESDAVQNEMQYDHLGNRIWHKDPDYGITTSLYNAYGQLTRRENSKGYVSTFEYDLLGRLVVMERKDADDSIVESTRWTYSEEDGLKGTLSSINYNEGLQTTNYAYDEFLRVRSVSEHIDGVGRDFVTSYTYDPASRVRSTTYPTGVTTTRHYNVYGYLTAIEEGGNGVVWHTDEMTERGMLKQFTLGNGVVTEYGYNSETNLLEYIKTKKRGAFIQNLSYGYDDFHNLAARIDKKRSLTESFTYDAMNRLTGVSLNEVATDAMAYDVYGRMTGKTSDGRLVFVTGQSSFDLANKPHALRSAQTDQGLFPEVPQSVVYTPFDKVQQITEGDDTLTYTYGYDYQRIKMNETVGGITRRKLYLDNCEYIAAGDGETALTYLSGPAGVFAVVKAEGGNSTIHYIHKDHLGSWTTVTDSEGHVEQELSFDAWGNLRDPDTWSGPFTGTPLYDRGFTGHEHLYSFGLINMNGRMYDPVMSSFLSVDAFVDNPYTAQGFNRYAYCMHNPLRYTDPSGWRKQGREPSSGNYEHWSMRYAVPLYEPRDYQNPYYLYNQSFFGNYEGIMCEGGGSFGGGGAASYGFESSYGYYVTHLTNGLYNYCFASTQLQLILNWKNNPCRTTSNEVEEAGIGYVSVGMTQFGNGRQSSYITWTDASGTTRYAETHNEHIGGHSFGSYCFSFNPIYTHSNSNNSRGLNNANIMAQSLGVPIGTINEGMEAVAKSYHNVPLHKVNSGLSKTQKVAALTKEGFALSKMTKGLGIFGAGVSSGITIYQMIDYKAKGGSDNSVYVKGSLDLIMTGVSFLGPVGFGIGITYFILDIGTDGFGGWGKIQ